MSYGWLTESAIIPKPAIPINVDNSSVYQWKNNKIDFRFESRHDEG